MLLGLFHVLIREAVSLAAEDTTPVCCYAMRGQWTICFLILLVCADMGMVASPWLFYCVAFHFLLCVWGDDAPLLARLENDLKMMCL